MSVNLNDNEHMLEELDGFEISGDLVALERIELSDNVDMNDDSLPPIPAKNTLRKSPRLAEEALQKLNVDHVLSDEQLSDAEKLVLFRKHIEYLQSTLEVLQRQNIEANSTIDRLRKNIEESRKAMSRIKTDEERRKTNETRRASLLLGAQHASRENHGDSSSAHNGTRSLQNSPGAGVALTRSEKRVSLTALTRSLSTAARFGTSPDTQSLSTGPPRRELKLSQGPLLGERPGHERGLSSSSLATSVEVQEEREDVSPLRRNIIPSPVQAIIPLSSDKELDDLKLQVKALTDKLLASEEKRESAETCLAALRAFMDANEANETVKLNLPPLPTSEDIPEPSEPSHSQRSKWALWGSATPTTQSQSPPAIDDPSKNLDKATENPVGAFISSWLPTPSQTSAPASPGNSIGMARVPSVRAGLTGFFSSAAATVAEAARRSTSDNLVATQRSSTLPRLGQSRSPSDSLHADRLPSLTSMTTSPSVEDTPLPSPPFKSLDHSGLNSHTDDSIAKAKESSQQQMPGVEGFVGPAFE